MRIATALAAVLASASSGMQLAGAQWPQFRGPDGMGTSLSRHR
jgi:hypothetical protein